MVAVTADPYDGTGLTALGIAAAHSFELVAKDNATVALDGGESVASLIESLQPRYFEGIRLYPVAGGPPYSAYTSIHALIGREKVAALNALLRGGWCNTLVTDERTAQAILEFGNTIRS